MAKLKNESCRGRKAMGLPTMAAIIGCPGRKATGLLIMAAIIWQAWLGLLGAQQRSQQWLLIEPLCSWMVHLWRVG